MGELHSAPRVAVPDERECKNKRNLAGVYGMTCRYRIRRPWNLLALKKSEDINQLTISSPQDDSGACW